MPFVKTSIKDSDAQITTGVGIVYGVIASAAATGGLWQLNDSTADSGTDLLHGFAQASSQSFIDLSNTPVQFNTAIYADIPGTNVTLTVLYTE